MIEYVYHFSLKDKKEMHSVTGVSLEDDGFVIIVKNEVGEKVGQFQSSEVQGYTRDEA